MGCIGVVIHRVDHLFFFFLGQLKLLQVANNAAKDLRKVEEAGLLHNVKPSQDIDSSQGFQC